MSLMPPMDAISVRVTRHDGTTLGLDSRQVAAVLDALKACPETKFVRDFIIDADSDPYGRRQPEGQA